MIRQGDNYLSMGSLCEGSVYNIWREIVFQRVDVDLNNCIPEYSYS